MDASQRIDKWLWFSRFVKSRALARELVAKGAVRVNRVKVERASHPVKAGDVLTLALRGRVMAVRVEAAGVRRGPAPEARALYAVLNVVLAGAGAETAPPRT